MIQQAMQQVVQQMMPLGNVNVIAGLQAQLEQAKLAAQEVDQERHMEREKAQEQVQQMQEQHQAMMEEMQLQHQRMIEQMQGQRQQMFQSTHMDPSERARLRRRLHVKLAGGVPRWLLMQAGQPHIR